MKGVIPFLAGTPVGHYRLSVLTGLTAGIAANAPIFSIAWLNTTFVRAIITRFRLQVVCITPYTAAQELSVSAYIARGFTAFDTGGTPIVLTGKNNQLNSAGDVPSVATCSIATTAALTAGTRTVDANPFLTIPGGQSLAGGASALLANESLIHSGDSQFPLNLQCAQAAAANAEGVVVQNNILQGAGGTTRICVEVDWLEYSYGAASGIAGVN